MATRGYLMPGREMTVGSVLSRGFGAIAAAPLLFVGTSVVLVALPSLAVRLATPAFAATMPADATFMTGLIAGFLGSSVVWFLFYLMAQAVLFRATVALADGRPEPLGDYVSAAARALLPLLGLAILMTLAVLFGWLLFVVPGIMLACIWSVAPPALVAERIGVFAAMSRSRDLTRGARWRVFGLAMLVYAIYFVASSVIGVGTIAASGLAAGTTAGVGPTIVASILSVILQAGFTAVWSAIQGALYVELRDWKDGPIGDRLSDIFA